MLAGTVALAVALGFAPRLQSETIQATYSQGGSTNSITLIVYNYSTPSDLQILSLAFQEGHDRELAAALSKTKAVGQCKVAGALSYDVAFIQMVSTPTGRTITFIASRPHPLNEADPPGSTESFDLAVGQFELNDTDPAKSTGFLYPASKLVIDDQGEFHYDLAGNPWALADVLDSKETVPAAASSGAVATSLDLGKDHAATDSH
jgi:hypothetical protein